MYKSKYLHFLTWLLFCQVDQIPNIVESLANGSLLWSEVMERYPKFEQQQAAK